MGLGVLLLILEGISILVKPKRLPSPYEDNSLLNEKKRPTKIFSVISSFTLLSRSPFLWSRANSTANGKGLPPLIGRG